MKNRIISLCLIAHSRWSSELSDKKLRAFWARDDLVLIIYLSIRMKHYCHPNSLYVWLIDLLIFRYRCSIQLHAKDILVQYSYLKVRLHYWYLHYVKKKLSILFRLFLVPCREEWCIKNRRRTSRKMWNVSIYLRIQMNKKQIEAAERKAKSLRRISYTGTLAQKKFIFAQCFIKSGPIEIRW